MIPWQMRIVEEKNALDQKIGKLTKFLNDCTLPDPAEMERLARQLRVMTAYSEVLGERIAVLVPTE